MVRTSLTKMAERAFKLQIRVCKHIRAQYSVCSYFKKVVSLMKAALINNQLEEFRVFPNSVEGIKLNLIYIFF
ncbi:unnamed protein product [Cuscuta epithymum]|uniref:Uncharacterized protein n=1 Tax=Cuscuta epithymum TaxID=186058 RepID=A0AAV0F3U4_9ASTE|nr:unnamed protein product [Cuscuta epithymum]